RPVRLLRGLTILIAEALHKACAKICIEVGALQRRADESSVHIPACHRTSPVEVWVIEHRQSKAARVAISGGVETEKPFHQPPAEIEPPSHGWRSRDIDFFSLPRPCSPPPFEMMPLTLRNGVTSNELLVRSKIRMRPSCSTMKRRVVSLAGAVMKTGELKLVLIVCRRRLLDCGNGESWLDPLPEHPITHPILTMTTP